MNRLYSVLSIALLIASLLGGVFLVKRSQDLRNRAYDTSCNESLCSGVTSESVCWSHAGSGCGWLDGHCTCNTSTPGITITGNCDSFTVTGGTARLAVARCKEEYYPSRNKQTCQADANRGVGCQTQMQDFGPGTHSITSDVQCGIYQVDATGNGWSCAKTGCSWNDTNCSASAPTNTPIPTQTPTNTPTPTPTPTNTPSPTPTSTVVPSTACAYTKIYNLSWQEITDLASLRQGQQVFFATKAFNPAAATKARFRVTINGTVGSWQETTQKNSRDEYYLQYTIPSTGNFSLSSMVYSAGGWH